MPPKFKQFTRGGDFVEVVLDDGSVHEVPIDLGWQALGEDERAIAEASNISLGGRLAPHGKTKLSDIEMDEGRLAPHGKTKLSDIEMDEGRLAPFEDTKLSDIEMDEGRLAPSEDTKLSDIEMDGETPDHVFRPDGDMAQLTAGLSPEYLSALKSKIPARTLVDPNAIPDPVAGEADDESLPDEYYAPGGPLDRPVGAGIVSPEVPQNLGIPQAIPPLTEALPSSPMVPQATLPGAGQLMPEDEARVEMAQMDQTGGVPQPGVPQPGVDTQMQQEQDGSVKPVYDVASAFNEQYRQYSMFMDKANTIRAKYSADKLAAHQDYVADMADAQNKAVVKMNEWNRLKNVVKSTGEYSPWGSTGAGKIGAALSAALGGLLIPRYGVNPGLQSIQAKMNMELDAYRVNLNKKLKDAGMAYDDYGMELKNIDDVNQAYLIKKADMVGELKEAMAIASEGYETSKARTASMMEVAKLDQEERKISNQLLVDITELQRKIAKDKHDGRIAEAEVSVKVLDQKVKLFGQRMDAMASWRDSMAKGNAVKPSSVVRDTRPQSRGLTKNIGTLEAPDLDDADRKLARDSIQSSMDIVHLYHTLLLNPEVLDGVKTKIFRKGERTAAESELLEKTIKRVKMLMGPGVMSDFDIETGIQAIAGGLTTEGVFDLRSSNSRTKLEKLVTREISNFTFTAQKYGLTPSEEIREELGMTTPGFTETDANKLLRIDVQTKADLKKAHPFTAIGMYHRTAEVKQRLGPKKWTTRDDGQLSVYESAARDAIKTVIKDYNSYSTDDKAEAKQELKKYFEASTDLPSDFGLKPNLSNLGKVVSKSEWERSQRFSKRSPELRRDLGKLAPKEPGELKKDYVERPGLLDAKAATERIKKRLAYIDRIAKDEKERRKLKEEAEKIEKMPAKSREQLQMKIDAGKGFSQKTGVPIGLLGIPGMDSAEELFKEADEISSRF